MRLQLALVLLVTACGGGGGDEAPVDAAIDAPPDAPPPPPNTFRFVVSQQRMPANNNEARAYGLDLDGDQVVDNQLGMVFATLAGQGLEIQPAIDRAVDRGEILLLAELGTDSFTATTLPGAFSLFKGANPTPAPCTDANDTTCRRHLAGTASFNVAADSARHPALPGTVAGGTFTAGPGKLQLITIVMGGDPLAIDLIGARVKIAMPSATMLGEGVIAGGITTTERDTKIYPRLQMAANAAMAQDCTSTTPPDCGCAPNSEGRQMQQLFDTQPEDCTVTLDEIQNNSLIQSLFAPDVMIDGQQALSVGIGFTAVHAAFTP